MHFTGVSLLRVWFIADVTRNTPREFLLIMRTVCSVNCVIDFPSFFYYYYFLISIRCAFCLFVFQRERERERKREKTKGKKIGRHICIIFCISAVIVDHASVTFLSAT